MSTIPNWLTFLDFKMLLLPTLVKLKAFLEVVFVALFADEYKRRVFLYVERILTD